MKVVFASHSVNLCSFGLKIIFQDKFNASCWLNSFHVQEMEIYFVGLSFGMRTHTNILPGTFIWESFLYVYCRQKLHHVWASMYTHITHSDIHHHVNGCCSVVIGISALCSESPRFESQSRKPLFWHIFPWYSSVFLVKCLDSTLKYSVLASFCILPNLSFTINLLCNTLMYTVGKFYYSTWS